MAEKLSVLKTIENDPAAAFEEFWRACPKKVGKALARAKFIEIVTNGLRTRTLDRDSGAYVELTHKADPLEIIAGMRRYRQSQIGADFGFKDDGRFLLHPATWLNRGGWEDE